MPSGKCDGRCVHIDEKKYIFCNHVIKASTSTTLACCSLSFSAILFTSRRLFVIEKRIEMLDDPSRRRPRRETKPISAVRRANRRAGAIYASGSA